jgi:hypothetical protein
MTALNPDTWKTPKTDSRNRRGVELPASYQENAEDTETVFRNLAGGWRPCYVVAPGWGRIAVEQEIEAVDAKLRRRWTVQAAAEAAILLIPGYTEIEGD